MPRALKRQLKNRLIMRLYRFTNEFSVEMKKPQAARMLAAFHQIVGRSFFASPNVTSGFDHCVGNASASGDGIDRAMH